MLNYALRRIAIAVPTLLIFSFLMFAVLYSAGDPLASLRQSSRILDSATIDRVIAENHLNDPLLSQYWRWLTGFVRGDWGTSFQSGFAPVFGEVTRTLGASLELLGVALVVMLLLATPIGILSATRPYSTFDSAATGFSYLGFATPTFFVGLLLQLLALRIQAIGWGVVVFALGLVIMAVNMRALVVHGRAIVLVCVGTAVAALGAMTFNAHRGELLVFTAQRFSATNFDRKLLSWDHLRHLILPVITLCVIQVAGWSRYLRSSMLDILNQDYLRTARAKGMSERRVIYRHALRNALIPMITIVSVEAASLFAGAIITETVFSWPGIGFQLVTAVRAQDIPMAMAIVMLGAIMVIVFNLVADLLYAVADPRIRLS